MQSRPSLYQLLQRHIVPRLLAALVVVGSILCLAIFYFAQKQVTNDLKITLSHLKNDITISLNSTQQLMEGIAANDLLINSFIDTQQNENYLPIFFDSLKFTRAKNVSLGLFQFNGEPFITNNWQDQVPETYNKAWQQTTLNDSAPFQLISEQGVLIAVPVLIAGQAEGALVLYTPSLQDFIYARDSDTYQLILSEQNRVLFSNYPAEIQPESTFDPDSYREWISESMQWNGLTLIDQAPVAEAFANVMWLIPAIIFTLGAAILVTIYTSNHAARLSARTLQSLHQAISKSSAAKQAALSQAPDDEAEELFVIRTAFDRLIRDLMNMSLSNRQFSNVIDSLEEILVVLDDNNKKLLINRTFTEYDQQCILSDNELLRVREHLEAGVEAYECLYKASEASSAVNIRWIMLPLTDANRKQAGTILVGNDTTHRRALESRINVISHAMKSATLTILIADANNPQFPTIYVNPYFNKVTGFSEDDVIRSPFFFLQQLHAEESKLASLQLAMREGKPFNDTLLCYRKDESPFYNQIMLTPVYTQSELTHFVAFFQDVTEREQTQQYLEEARLRAEESARLKSDFLASMSHEVRTPLHGISGALQLVSKTSLQDEQVRFIDLAKDSLDNLQHIVDDILDFSKIEAGQLNLENIPYNLDSLLKTIYEQYSISCEQKGLLLTLHCDLNNHTMVEGDPVRLRQILGNLLSNAVKFTDQGNIGIKVTLLTPADGPWRLQIAVSDSGIGISKDSINSIFEVFRQEDVSTTRRFGGTGLGLSISRQLCLLMDGNLVVESEKGIGSTFSFDIAVGAVTGDVEVSNQDSADPVEAKNIRPANILVVEDNEVNQLIAREHLSQHKTLVAKNGREALEALTRMKLTFDVILMDCHMPEMDGFETTRRIRKGEGGDKYVNVPIIALTANAMKGDRDQCRAAGMDDYISKPFTASSLLQIVAKHCPN